MRHLVAVAEEMHFGRAAQRLNMAQPPLSQSIKRLEDYLGVQLLERSRSGLSVTPAGQVFVEEARRTLMQADLTRAVTLRAAQSNATQVHVSFIGPAMFRLLPPVVLRHHQMRKEIEIRLSQESSPKQMVGIMQGRYDVAFIHPSTDLIEGGDAMMVERCRFVAAIPEDWPLARQESVSLREVGEQPLIMAPQREAPGRVSEQLTAFRDIGVSPRVVQESMQTHSTLSLVAARLGCALAMETAAETGVRGVAFRPIHDLPGNLRWETAMVWHPQHISSAAKLFISDIKAYVAEHPELIARD
ncbi:LysR family transcriptional regulator [Sphingomonas sp. CA1-15]|uniref:LysR family transcriptional regulator n=2 Tax=Sphingomonas immobilis TaxID=3063997 RepID=A0ABT8ZX71_9SPHN|nr:LysR family transcriptional regulator [Sphingomonas sp. CA1-15]